MLYFSMAGIFFISVLWKYKKIVVVGFCFIFATLGIWRYQQVVSLIHYPEEGTVTLTAKVIGEPDIRDSDMRLIVKNGDFPGKILLVSDKYPEYRYGDNLKVSGKIQIPHEIEDFNYKDYLTKDGIYSVIYRPQIEFLGGGDYGSLGAAAYAAILSFKSKLRESINRNLSPPQSSILAAMILGDKRQLSQEWKDILNYAGLRHLTAISGMHVAVLSAILMSFFVGAGLWRKDAFLVSLVILFIFIVMTGLQPSAVRAGIMGGLFLLSQRVGRTNMSSRAVVFAAALMLVHNPLLLRSDAGFQLSFLAMLGIIHFLPVVQSWLRKFPDFLSLKSVLAVTVSAQVFTLPVLIYNFGYVSLVSLFTNILVVPLLPFIMVLGFVSAFLGTFLGFLGWISSFLVWLPLAYLVKVAEWFSFLPFAALFFEIHWVWLLVFYLAAAVFIRRFNEKEKLRFLKY